MSDPILKRMFNLMYPIGSVYISVNNTNPAILFGGTWVQIKDKFLLSAGDTYAGGKTGGNASHKHTTSGHTLTTSEIPSHNHEYADRMIIWDASGNNSDIVQNGSYTNSCVRFKSWGTKTNSTGGGGSHSHGDTGTTSNMPPYLVVYVWKRTA